MAPKKAQKTVEVSQPEAPSPAPEVPLPVSSDPPVPAPEVTDVDRFSTVLEKLQSFASEIKEVIITVKALQKEFNKAKSQKGGRKAKKAAATGGDAVKRAPSGFAKPTALSAQLCEFLSLPEGSSLARTEVTRVINKYVKDNSLQDAGDKRKINPDAKLKSIMTIADGEKLTYFNLQSYIKHHFIKAA